MSGMLISMLLFCSPPRKTGKPGDGRFRSEKESDQKILAALESGPKTRREIAEASGLAISTVWKRIKSLEEDGEVTPVGKVKVKCNVSLIWKLKRNINAG